MNNKSSLNSFDLFLNLIKPLHQLHILPFQLLIVPNQCVIDVL
jgi:hypothetical protein